MLNIFTRIAEFFTRAAEPDYEDDFDPEDPSVWNDEPPPEREVLYAGIGGTIYA